MASLNADKKILKVSHFCIRSIIAELVLSFDLHLSFLMLIISSY